MKPAIDFWSKLGAADPKGDKKKKEVYMACNMNLAYAYYYGDQLEKSKAHAQKVDKAYDGKLKVAKKFIEEVDAQIALMKLHGINSMHYKRDLSNSLAPSDVKKLNKELETLEEDNTSITGSVTKGGKIITG